MTKLLAFLAAVFLAGCVTSGKTSGGSGSKEAKGDLDVTGGRVYRGQDGQKVEMALLRPEKGKKFALMRITNAQSEWDGKILRVEIVEWGQGKVDIKTKVGGAEYNTIVGRGDGWWGSNNLSYELYAPGLSNDGLPIYNDIGAGDAFDPKTLAEAYEPGKDPGALASGKHSGKKTSKKKAK